MKKLEIIQKILEKTNDVDISELLSNTNHRNLAMLCILDKKYLTNENLNYIFTTKDSSLEHISKYYVTSFMKNYCAIAVLISNYPELLDKLPNNIKLSLDSKLLILEKQPQLVSKLKIPLNKIDKDFLIEMIKIRPQIMKELKVDSSDFYLNDWLDILIAQPSLLDKCDVLDEFGNSWTAILIHHPYLEKYCNSFDKFLANDWNCLINEYPKFISICNKFANEKVRTEILLESPMLIDKLITYDINQDNFNKILYKSKKYHKKVINEYIKYFKDSEVLTNMIGIYPELKELYTEKDLWKYVDFNKLNKFNAYKILT